MKSHNIYFILVTYFVFLLVRKIIASAVEYKLPTYDNLKGQSLFWKKAVLFRTTLVVLDIIFIIYMLTFYKFNIYLTIIFYLFLLADIEYFLFDERYIDFIFGKKIDSRDNKFVNFMDVYGDNFNNIVKLVFSGYVLYYIFINR